MSIESYPSPNGVLTSLIWRKTAAGGETSLSGYDNASQALSYTPGQEQVYLNGILLVRGADYTATNGTSITNLTALTVDDFIQINCYNNFSVASVPAASLTGTVTNAQLANSSITINGSAVSLGGSVSLPGDIESVTASSPLTGGGSTGALTIGIQSASTSQSGAVQLSDSTSTTSSVLAATPTAVKSAYDLANGAIPKTLTTTTGDIIYASGANTPARLGIGSTGNILTVSGGVPTWTAPASGGGMTLLSTTTLSGSSTTVSSINQTYNSLYILVRRVNMSSTGTLRIRPNGLTTATQNSYIVNATVARIERGELVLVPTERQLSNGETFNGFSIQIDDYANTNNDITRPFKCYGQFYRSDDSLNSINNAGGYFAGGAITSIEITGAGTFSGGTMLIYGVK
jgi:hypothetical protein